MKETYYFVHDYHARHDIKIEALFSDFKLEGIGAYWCIIEILYEENGYIELTLCERIATVLQTKYDTITTIIKNYGLFENDGKKFWSESVLRRLKEREEKSNKARESVNKRWNKYDRNTNVYDRNTIKESKVKESKVKEIKEYNIKSRFAPPSLEEIKNYCEERKNTINAEQFFNFYSAKGWMVGKNKMKDWKACVRTWEIRNKDDPKTHIETDDEYIKKLKQNYGETN